MISETKRGYRHIEFHSHSVKIICTNNKEMNIYFEALVHKSTIKMQVVYNFLSFFCQKLQLTLLKLTANSFDKPPGKLIACCICWCLSLPQYILLCLTSLTSKYWGNWIQVGGKGIYTLRTSGNLQIYRAAPTCWAKVFRNLGKVTAVAQKMLLYR